MTELLDHWGYLGIFLAVVLGNVGVPIPEETVLLLAGYAASRGVLRLPVVVIVGVISAAAGDNIGYWLGHRYGRRAIERFGHLAFIPPARLEKISAFMTRYGALAIFAARFIVGVRTLAGPLAGATGVRPLTFVTANILGALVYVPYAVGIGYGVGWGLGDTIERLITGRVDYIILGLLVLALIIGAIRFHRARRAVPATPPQSTTDPGRPA
jgi:membrane protein DedA with SNARE-associated domain